MGVKARDGHVEETEGSRVREMIGQLQEKIGQSGNLDKLAI